MKVWRIYVVVNGRPHQVTCALRRETAMREAREMQSADPRPGATYIVVEGTVENAL